VVDPVLSKVTSLHPHETVTWDPPEAERLDTHYDGGHNPVLAKAAM
jgi:hypothetical protein